jgi:glycosyltransferase involved in cell wall biosynthesis
MVVVVLDIIIPVYNGSDTIGRTLSALLRQLGSGEVWHRIIVVDDASSDDTAALVEGHADNRILLLRTRRRGGRANACNCGAAASDADALLFLDADCLPVHADLIKRHAELLAAGKDASFGQINGAGVGFWARLAAEVARDRHARAIRGDYLAMTSCNMAVSLEVFRRVGGFCTEYRHYGFEDRDLLASLQLHGCRFGLDPEAVVEHNVDAATGVLCRKMEESGQHTAAIFRRRHPRLYSQMRYARLDVHTACEPLRTLSVLLVKLVAPARWLSERLVDTAWLPFRLRVAVLRSAIALAYMRGTMLADAASSAADR